MMYKRVCGLLLACLMAWAAVPAYCEDISPQKLLVLSISANDNQQTLRVIKRIMLYMNLPVDYVSWHQEQLSLEAYSGVIIYAEDGSTLDEQMADELRDSEKPLFVIGQGGIEQLAADTVYYEGSTVVRFATEAEGNNDVLVRREGLTLLAGDAKGIDGTVFIAANAYPLCQQLGQVTHLAYFDPETPSMDIMLSTLLQAWMWPYENVPTTYGQYLVLDNVYPFMEPAELMEITDMLEEEGVHYGISLMPMYANAEYPSMKRFCEYLRYVQSRGAGLILRAPLASLGRADIEELKNHITIAYGAYSLYQVYPLAIQVPEEYLLCEDGLDAISGFRTVFMFEGEQTVDMDAMNTNIAYGEGHQIIAPSNNAQSAFTTAYAQVIYLDPHEGVDALRTQVKRIKSSKRVLKSLTRMENTLYVGDQYILGSEDGLLVNGTLIDTKYAPFIYESDYTYDRGFFKYLTDQIEMSNQIILVCVSLACLVFLIMIHLSRRVIKREIILGPKKGKKTKHANVGHAGPGGGE